MYAFCKAEPRTLANKQFSSASTKAEKPGKMAKKRRTVEALDQVIVSFSTKVLFAI